MATSTPRRARRPPKATLMPRPSRTGMALSAEQAGQSARPVEDHDDEGKGITHLVQGRRYGMQHELAEQVQTDGSRGGAEPGVQPAEHRHHERQDGVIPIED